MWRIMDSGQSCRGGGCAVPRLGYRKPEPGARLTDYISLGALTHVVPPALVDDVVRQTGRQELRHRLLPARVVVYYVLAMALYSHAGYEEVMRYVVEGLSWLSHWRQGWSVPTKAAIFKGRARLGSEPLRLLFERIARPLGQRASRGVWYRQWRLMSLDGTTLDVPDTIDNDRFFGRSKGGRGSGIGAFPKVRVVALIESGTHAVVAGRVTPYRDGEITSTRHLLAGAKLEPGMLVLADRGFFGYDLWTEAADTGADLLWRVKVSLNLPMLERLPDGSYLSRIYPSQRSRRKSHQGMPVRVIEYTLDAAETDGASPTLYRLITTVLDADMAPAAQLAPLYHERWEIESVFDEFKTHQRGPGVVLRSKTPDGVVQEVYGYLLTHFAIRSLMHDAALEADEDPDHLSFLRTLHIVRRKLSGRQAFSPTRHSTPSPLRHRRDP